MPFTPRALLTSGLLAALTIGAAACGSSTDSTSSAGSTPAASTPVVSAPAAPAASASSASSTAAPVGKLSANKATAEELQSIPGVGPEIAKEILEYRPYDAATGPARFRDELAKYIDNAEIERIMTYLDFGA